jgi:hypothetical protein
MIGEQQGTAMNGTKQNCTKQLMIHLKQEKHKIGEISQITFIQLRFTQACLRNIGKETRIMIYMLVISN